MKKRVREVTDRENYENLIDDYVQNGYEISKSEDDFCRLKKTSFGGWGWNIIIFIITCWWTFLLGNLVYMLVCHQVNSKMVELHYKP